MTLIIEGFDQHVPKGYIYVAIAFSVMVELLNMKLRKPHAPPVKLHEPYAGGTDKPGLIQEAK